MLTVIVGNVLEQETLKRTMDALGRQSAAFRKKIRVVLLHSPALDKKGRKRLKACEGELRQTWGDRLLVMEANGRHFWKQCEDALREVSTRYVAVIRCGDYYLKNALRRACTYLDRLDGTTDVVSIRQSFSGRKEEPKEDLLSLPGRRKPLYILEEEEGYSRYPATFEGCLFRTDSVKGLSFDESHRFHVWDEFVCRVLDRRRTIARIDGSYFVTDCPRMENPSENPDAAQKGWYLDSLRYHCLPLLDWYEQKYGAIPKYIQSHVLFVLKSQHQCNQGQQNRPGFSPEELDAYDALCHEVLSRIDDEFLVKRGSMGRRRRLSDAMSEWFFHLKYQEDLRRDVWLEEYEDLDGQKNIQLVMRQSGQEKEAAQTPALRLDVLDEENGAFRLEMAAPGYLTEGSCSLIPLLNGTPIQMEDTARYADYQYFEKTVYRKHTFRVEIPAEKLEKRNELRFIARYGQKTLPLRVETSRYTSRIASAVKGSYWCRRGYLVRFLTGEKGPGLLIEKAGVPKKAVREIRLLYSMAFGNVHSGRMLILRLLYWMTRPYYGGKNIWLSFDKLYKGGDCGEYFYKYVVSRKDKEIVPAYVINADSPDCARLREEGYQPAVRGTLRQKLLFLNAKIVFGTHVGICGFNDFTGRQIRFLQDRLELVNMCIQHGLTVQDLSSDANQAYNNNKRYYCASKYEVENLRRPQYGYDDPRMIRLTGIPRYDGLVNRDQRQVLITPTWRNYIAMPPVMGHTRPYNPDFKNTEYFRIYNALISDRKLIETARRTGYRLIFLLHPVTSEQLCDYEKNDSVDILQATTIDYERILTESSLMVTDYSGVQFDFAYMRKPVVYYHPPALPPHYREGGFFYDTQGFGEICKDHQTLVDVLCAYMEDECRLKPFYRARQDDFFAFSDHENCRRIFEDAYAYQEGQRQSASVSRRRSGR